MPEMRENIKRKMQKGSPPPTLSPVRGRVILEKGSVIYQDLAENPELLSSGMNACP